MCKDSCSKSQSPAQSFVKFVLPLHMKDGFPDAMSSSVPFMRKGHCFSTVRQVDWQASTFTEFLLSEFNSHIGRWVEQIQNLHPLKRDRPGNRTTLGLLRTYFYYCRIAGLVLGLTGTSYSLPPKK